MDLTVVTESKALANGVSIPSIGYGTWQTPDGETAVTSVRSALELGFRHVDTAAAYGNEASVGEGIRQSGIPRGEIFLTSKLANPDHGYEATKAAFQRSLKLLGTDYLDLYLIHWPNPAASRDNWQEANAGTWKAMEEFYEEGQIRAIGVSNFFPKHFEALFKTANIMPMVNQISLSPGLAQPALCEYCRERNMLLEAYSPLGTGRTLQVPELLAYAKKYGRSAAQICIRWSLQMGFLPLPKSTNPRRMLQNLQVFDFELSSEDVASIAALDCGAVVRDPDTITF
ncbi:MAG: aldo/keto reductase [Oscillospiraceae bacterium]